MADRVSASIVIGGMLSATLYSELVQLAADEGLSLEWDGEPFAAEHRTLGQPLRLYAHEGAWGIFERLESWCAEQRLPFTRWSGGYGSEWGAQRIVSDTGGKHVTYAVTEDGEVVVDRATVDRLGSIAAIRAYFDAADFVVPPLVVEGDELAPAAPAPVDSTHAAGGIDVE